MQKAAAKHALYILGLAFITGILFGVIESKVAGAECTPIYGGGEVCPKVANALIDKQVFDPEQNLFVNNLTESDYRFAPEAIVIFRIIIKNTGDTALNAVNITDTFPAFIKFLSGVGHFNNGKLTIEVGQLEPGATREFIVRGTVAPQNQLPDNQSLICPVNRVEMRGKVDDDIVVSDAAQLCIEKQVLAKQASPSRLPAAGADNILLLASALSGAGLFLRKKYNSH